MKKRLREMEEEAAKLKDIQEQSSAELSGNPAGAAAVGAGAAAAAGGPAAAAAATAETDARSIYVGSVDYSATPEELQAHFADCGTVNRVTILCNKFTGHPKGYAYIEFADEDGVKNATILNDSMFKDRQIKVRSCVRRFWRVSGGSVALDGCSSLSVWDLCSRERRLTRLFLMRYTLGRAIGCGLCGHVPWFPLIACDGIGGPEALQRAGHERRSHVHAGPRPWPRPWWLPWRRLPGWWLPRRLPWRVWRAPAVGPVLAPRGSPHPFFSPLRALCAPRLRRVVVVAACCRCRRYPMIDARQPRARMGAGVVMSKKKKEKKKEKTRAQGAKGRKKKKKKEMGVTTRATASTGSMGPGREWDNLSWLRGRSPAVPSTATAGDCDGTPSPPGGFRRVLVQWSQHCLAAVRKPVVRVAQGADGHCGCLSVSSPHGALLVAFV